MQVEVDNIVHGQQTIHSVGFVSKGIGNGPSTSNVAFCHLDNSFLTDWQAWIITSFLFGLVLAATESASSSIPLSSVTIGDIEKLYNPIYSIIFCIGRLREITRKIWIIIRLYRIIVHLIFE